MRELCEARGTTKKNCFRTFNLKPWHYTKSIFLLLSFTVPIGIATVVAASEMKFGFVYPTQKYERGLGINLEYVGDKFSGCEFLSPHIGVSKNLSGFTTAIYTGISFKKFLNSPIFIEASLGLAVHDGPLNRKNWNKRGRIFGSRMLFRESLELGYAFNKVNISAFIDHISNANLAPPNHGLTNMGIRFGFKL